MSMSLMANALKSAQAATKKENPSLIPDPKAPLVVANTGSVIIDQMTGCGGFLVQNRMVELVGVESSGKTTLTLQSARCAQKMGWKGIFIDTEGSFDFSYCEAIGPKVDNKTFCVLQPLCAEEMDKVIDIFVREMGKELDYIIIDSIATTRPRGLVQKDSDDPTRPGAHAGWWSAYIHKLRAISLRYGIAVLFTNQVRAKIQTAGAQFSVLNTGIGAGFNARDTAVTTTGGMAIRHAMDARYLMVPAGQIKESVLAEGEGEDEIRTAHWCHIKNLKNKMKNPFRKAKFVIRYGYGIDDSLPIYDLLKSRGLLETGGGGKHVFSGIPGIIDPYQVKGKAAFLQWLSDPGVMDKISEYITDLYKENTTALDLQLDKETLVEGTEFDPDSLILDESGKLEAEDILLGEDNDDEDGD